MTRCHKKFCFLAVICLFGLQLLLIFVSNQEKCVSLKGLQRWIRWPKTPKTRLLVIGQGRSGTSFVSKMLTIGEQVFEVYEPLRLIYRNSDNETKLQVLQASLSCVLTPKTVWKLYERICRTLSTCEPPLEQVEELSHKCKHCFSGTVVKVLPHRIPGGKLSSLLPVLTYRAVGVDIRLLHVVRDPRASINSRIKLGWFPEFNHTKFTKMVENYCNVIIDNIEFGQNLDDSVKHRYKLVFYRDIAAQPLNTAKEIFTFAGMDLDENTFEWIKATTNLSNKAEANKANFKSPYSLVRNSKANIEKWRIESPPERTNAIENICKPLLELIDELSMSENVHWITE